MRIDSHQHFWVYDPERYDWITPDMEAIKNDFLPGDLAPLLERDNFSGCILVQADQHDDTNEILLQWAEEADFVKGVVGWIDLERPDLSSRLEYYSQFPALKGFRHMIQDEKDRAFLLRDGFISGVAELAAHGYTYDVLVLPDQLHFVPEFLEKLPDNRFVLNHLAKPDIKGGNVGYWAREFKKLSRFPNLYCKVSGMITEADWNDWEAGEFKEILDVAVETFGVSRLMYGSNWPVCLLASTYDQQLKIKEDYFAAFSADEQDQIFGLNAKRFYGIE